MKKENMGRDKGSVSVFRLHKNEKWISNINKLNKRKKIYKGTIINNISDILYHNSFFNFWIILMIIFLII